MYNLFHYCKQKSIPCIPTFPLLSSELTMTFFFFFFLLLVQAELWNKESLRGLQDRDYRKIWFHDDEGLSRNKEVYPFGCSSG